jgi:hypothetical protein
MLAAMNVEEIEKIATLLLVSGLKFLFAPLTAEYMGFDFGRSFLWTTTGGSIGIIAFTYLGDLLVAAWKKFVSWLKAIFLRTDPKAVRRLPPKVFTPRNKRIVWIKMKFGLFGLAFLTPCLLSIPIGTFVINRMYRRKWKILLYLFTALLFWSLLLNWLTQLLKLSQYLHSSP